MKKKIYITSLHLQHGGIEMAITLLANALVKREYEVEILCTYNLGEPVYRLDKRVKVTYLTDVKPNKAEFYAAVKKKNPVEILKQGLYAVKVLSLKKSTMIEKIKEIQDGTIIATRNDHAVILSKYGKDTVKRIAQLHHDHRFEKKLLNDFKKGYGRIDYFVLLTDWLKQEIEEIMGCNKYTKLVVIPNFLAELEEKKEERLNQVIAVGRMHEVKGFPRMLDIWKEVKTDEPYVLKLVGAGEQFEEIKEKVKSCGMEDKVILTGALPHDQVMEEMSKSKAYLMTSYTEAFPFVLIEAMSMGLPILAYDVRVGPKAMVSDGVNGYLIQENDRDTFITDLEGLLANKETWQSMSEKALERAEMFTEERVLEMWMEIL